MERENWSHIKELFVAALGLPADRRPSYLAEACGADDALRRRVQTMLESHEQAPSFLEAPPHVDAASGVAPSLEGRRIGAYQLLERIGAGGMGEVYAARDTRLNRDVAIKV